jgi:hypothetical protein
MERLREINSATQLKREQQDMSVLHRARLFDNFAAGAGGAASGAGATGVGASPNAGNPYDRYFSEFQASQQAQSQGAAQGIRARQDPFSSAAFSHEQIGPNSVSDALREASHLEELALAQRAKARSLALAGALQQRFGMSDSSSSDGRNMRGGETGGAGDRPSFGRPFGRRD